MYGLRLGSTGFDRSSIEREESDDASGSRVDTVNARTVGKRKRSIFLGTSFSAGPVCRCFFLARLLPSRSVLASVSMPNGCENKLASSTGSVSTVTRPSVISSWRQCSSSLGGRIGS